MTQTSFLEQFWLNFLVNTNDVDLMNKLVTVQSEYSLVYSKLKTNIYNKQLLWKKQYQQLLNFNYLNLMTSLQELNLEI